MRREDRGFFYRFRVPFKVIGIILLCAVALTGAYYLSKLGPSKVDPKAVNAEYDEVAAAELLAESEAKEELFRTRADQRPPTEADYAVLTEAIALLEKYIDMRGGYHQPSRERREELLTLREQNQAQAIFDQSLRLEEESEQLAEQGKFSEALGALERAYYLQQSINERYNRSSLADPRRRTRLDRSVQQLKAKPIYEESIAAEEEAKAAIAAENFGRARLLYRRSLDRQKELNLKFRNLQYADVQRLSDLEQQLASLESSDLYEEILTLRQAGEQAEAQEQFAEAAEAYQNAYRLQRRLNDEFPASRFAGKQPAEELQASRENALSRDLGDSIVADIAELDKALRDRIVWRAVEILRTLYPKAEQFAEQFPRSRVLGDDTLLRLQYLSAIEEDIEFLQDRIYGQLLLIDGVNEWRMLRTEVSQALFMSVMLGANPSRREGDLLPVESGTWDDASDFAERVSWLLGRPARLPNQDEFYAAIGSLRYVDLRSISWNLENSDNTIHEIATKNPNSQGYHDLLGNVGEWLESSSIPGEGEAYLAGGSVETSIDALANIPMEIDNRRTRNRHAGFRIVVNLPYEK